MKISKLFNDFFESEKSAGIFLIITTVISLFLANSIWANSYIKIWDFHLANHSLNHWINDGLMTVFFLLIGLELEREIYIGELSNLKKATFPFIGALGGMVVPAGIFLIFNYGLKTQSGAGIPMATDIAFAIGILSLLGNKVPVSLKVFLTALAVIDDLGAIIIIALFYTKTILFVNLFIALTIMGILFILNRLKVNNYIPYIIGGFIMWYFMLNSGIHATITGVLLAFVIPFGDGSPKTISYKMQHSLHKPVAFIILPLFALANTCLPIQNNIVSIINANNSMGILLGLLVGKPLGIWLFTYIASKVKICSLPKELNWYTILGVAILGGIGFTMSIFITSLAYTDSVLINNSKIIILITSLLSGTLGYLFLKLNLKNKKVS